MEELHTNSFEKNENGTPMGDKNEGNHSCARREKMKQTNNSTEMPKTKLCCQQ